MAKELDPQEQRLEIDGLSIGYFDAGNGNPMIVFPAKDGELADPLLLKKLAESHRIISLNLSSRDFTSANQVAEKLPGALTSIGIERCSVMGISTGARPAIELAISASERVDRLILISPLHLTKGAELPDLAGIKSATLVLVGTRDIAGAIEAGRLCREKIPSCHLSFVYGAGHALAGDRPEACLDPITQFLEQGEQFIIFRESQVLRP
ncbi:MAG: alpha/beta hydrolase [Deltaproteobacteria bacterium]|nr:alpha/beta hydrolase [Deltaproteobacteria bacterium]